MPKPRRRKIYLKPRVVPAKVARKRGLRRGEILAQYKPRMKTPAELRIEFLPDGRVRLPRFREVTLGKIEPEEPVTHPNPYTAIRATAHAIESVSSEFERIKAIQSYLAAMHAVLYDEWRHMNQRQRESAKKFIFYLVDLVQPRRKGYEHLGLEDAGRIKRVHISVPTKKMAVRKLMEALQFMERNNIGAARALLAAASNYLIARMNTLLTQEPRLKRRKWILIRENIVRESEVLTLHDELRRIRDLLERPEVPEEIIKQKLKNIRKNLRELTDRYRRFKGAEEHLKKAIGLIRTGSRGAEVVKALRKAAGRIYLIGSECAIFPRAVLAELKREGGERARIVVVRNQLALFAENAKYWFERATPRQKKNMYGFLKELRSLITGTKAQPVVVEIAKAERELRSKKFEQCKETLMEAVKRMDALLKPRRGKKK
ncbi:MAG: hypothetical protein J7L44_04050 [Candidatus Diapherotrites archaeon]|nr:hypothetical protein [Candidatus Diapherotrites archaeon]